MGIDPQLGLAMSVAAGKGVFALLLGSGVSTAAGIPTGFAVQRDLIRRLAHLQGVDEPGDLDAWYAATFKEDPQYSRLLEQLAPSPVERSALLRPYFEATADEREQGLKVPTKTHHAIASLVAAGYIRIIITTNFDRLIEQALEAAGVTPVVVSSPATVGGALPFVHARCYVLKVNGDYLDAHTMNTVTELSRYDRALHRLLARIVDEHGLIVCGWSAEWDVAVRRVLMGTRSRRFTTYWAWRSDLSPQATDIVTHRGAVVLPIQDATTFFVKLKDDVLAIERFGRPHPLTAATAVVTAKRFLAEDRYRIDLHDLVMEETERVHAKLASIDQELRSQLLSSETYEQALRKYAAATEVLGHLAATGGYWYRAEHRDLWMRVVGRLAHPPGASDGLVAWAELRYLPALLVVYAAGIGAIVRENYGLLGAMLVDTQVTDRRGIAEAFALAVDVRQVLEFVAQRSQSLAGPSYTLYVAVRPWMHDLIPDDLAFDRTFDRYEYLSALVYEEVDGRRGRAPLGRFAAKRPETEHVANRVGDELARQGETWRPLTEGLFQGSIEHAREVKEQFDRVWQAQRARFGF